jgi:Arc/MetJ-type ribon-helix-helix transcriptional regulator
MSTPSEHLRRLLRDLADRRHDRRARLPWDEVEAEAARQGCSAADILFDRAGRDARVSGRGGVPDS